MKNGLFIQLNTEVWKEGKMFVAYAKQLDISSCGTTLNKARKNLAEAIELFLEEAEKKGVLIEILKEAGFYFDQKWKTPKIVSREKLKIPN